MKVAAVRIEVGNARPEAKSCAGPAADVWVGQFKAIATLDTGTQVTTDLNEVTGEPDLTFLRNGETQLEFDDYNDDGDPDFTIEQPSCMGFSGYHVLTIAPSGRISALPIAGDRFGGISSSIGIWPTENGFRVGVYNNAQLTQSSGDRRYRWSRKQHEFVVDTGARKAPK